MITSLSPPPSATISSSLEAKAEAERDKSQLVASDGALKSQVEQLQSAVSQLQHELQENHRELETRRGGNNEYKLHVCSVRVIMYTDCSVAMSNQAVTEELQKQ